MQAPVCTDCRWRRNQQVFMRAIGFRELSMGTTYVKFQCPVCCSTTEVQRGGI
jgi:predicted RNA-binding Zn-ribbon protein involved in translation (DUF1610 family)